ncbi:cytochrome b5 domain-containing protein [Candidatus Peregrinibacteria bacterium]|nr:cytochrome b5 domain-containing protein [Candidatus Peregrinibacteria bacterium]
MGGSLTIEDDTDTNMETDDATVKTYTLAEVAENDSEESCWIVIDGKVYDSTPFIGDHPGGDAILKGCGKDHTEEWSAIEPHENAGPKLEDLYIGRLEN